MLFSFSSVGLTNVTSQEENTDACNDTHSHMGEFPPDVQHPKLVKYTFLKYLKDQGAAWHQTLLHMDTNEPHHTAAF